jgi:biopolymer transport protein ExbD
MGRFEKKKIVEGNATVELNIMPFIDVFSLLCTFLLFSAVFISVGIHVVQVPFLSNAAPTKDDSKRTLKIKVDASLDHLALESSFTKAPLDEQKQTFAHDPDGIKKMHQSLIALRLANPDADKVDLFMDDALSFNQLIKLLDVIKVRDEHDPPLPSNLGMGLSSEDLFPKVVLGSVIL